MTLLTFPSNPADYKKVDPEFALELQAAKELKLKYILVDVDKMEITKKEEFSGLGIYRGWMLRLEEYTALFNLLQSQGIQLINTPDEYAWAHHFPNNYAAIKNLSPRALVCPESKRPPSLTDTFGSNPVIVKDYVKSEKALWKTACFIPNASDVEKVEQVVNTFVKVRGDRFTGGLVFKEYVELLKDEDGQPIEFRFWIRNNEIVWVNQYSGQQHWSGSVEECIANRWLNLSPGRWLKFRLSEKEFIPQSTFCVVDVARSSKHGWLILELGDGQVSGLPEFADYVGFLKAITKKEG